VNRVKTGSGVGLVEHRWLLVGKKASFSSSFLVFRLLLVSITLFTDTTYERKAVYSPIV
jgi:hypothetical protein